MGSKQSSTRFFRVFSSRSRRGCICAFAGVLSIATLPASIALAGDVSIFDEDYKPPKQTEKPPPEPATPAPPPPTRLKPRPEKPPTEVRPPTPTPTPSP